MAVKSKINRKHFVAMNNQGTLFFVKPKDWSRANQHLFPKCKFQLDKTPTVEQIENVLSKMGYTSIDNFEVVIFYKYDTI